MKIALSHNEYSWNGDVKEVSDGVAVLDTRTDMQLKRLAREYRTSKAGLAAMALAYYFGDGANHLNCAHCEFGEGSTCTLPEVGGQTTVPLLDKGTVVVGLSRDDLGE